MEADYFESEAAAQSQNPDEIPDLSKFNIISIQHSIRAAPNRPFLEYDKYDLHKRSVSEVEFYDRCIKIESENQTIENVKIDLSHWVLYSQDEQHFKLKGIFYPRILIMIGQRYAYWFAETEYPVKCKKYGVVHQSYWFNTKRRKRSINFTDSDRQILMNLVQPHLSVIENKRLDKFTSKLKSETWENIKSQYNQLNAEPRTALQLKLFYEANKYRMRKIYKNASDANESDGKSDEKIVKIELDRKTILDALAQAENEVEENADESESPKAKIKCVNIKKLQETRQISISHSQDLAKQSPLLPIPSKDNSEVSTPGYKTQSINTVASISSPNLPTTPAVPTVTSSTDSTATSTSNRQDELHSMRMKILEDERLFRRQEHLKHMEYFEIGIMALKAFLLKQAHSMPTIQPQK